MVCQEQNVMNRQDLSILLHVLILEQNNCDRKLYFDKKTNLEKRHNMIKNVRFE